jgi:tripartite-type tricarboxylate transporter receptor subunit TctC
MENRKPNLVMVIGILLIIFAHFGLPAIALAADSYPNKPIRLLLPDAMGGSRDIIGRLIGGKFAEQLGQPLVPENRPGAGGNVAHEMTAKARPDGYTLVLVAGSLVTSPSLFKQVNYDWRKELAPISRIGAAPHIATVSAHPAHPINSIKELVQFARANPGKLNYGSTGIGTMPHLSAELFKSLAKIKMTHVSYKGGAQALIGLIGGEIDLYSSNAANILPHIQAGKAKAIAVLTKERLPALPDVPTSKEAGMEGWVAEGWYGLLTTAGTPRAIVNRLNTEWNRIAAMPDVKEKLQRLDFYPIAETPEQFAEFLNAESLLWAKIIKEAGIVAE